MAMTAEEQMKHHDDYYRKIHAHATETLARVVDDDKAETRHELVEQLAEALRHRKPDDLARAIVAVIDACHAHLELNEHKED